MTIKKAKMILYDEIMTMFDVKSEILHYKELPDDYVREVGDYYNDFETIMELKGFSCEECLNYAIKKIHSIPISMD